MVSLPTGAMADVLCLTPLIPIIVNNGHECVFAEAFRTTFDPLPSGPAFNVPADRLVSRAGFVVWSGS